MSEKRVDLKSIPSVPRKALGPEFKTNVAIWRRDASAMGLSFGEYLNRISPEPMDEADPQNAVHSLMRQKGIVMKDGPYRDSSLIEECIDDEESRVLLGTDLQMYYDNILFRGAPHPSRLGARAGIGGLTGGSPFRAFDDLDVQPAQEQGNRVPLANILARVRTVPGTDGRIPEVLPPKDGSTRFDVSEAAQIPVNTVTTGSRKFSLKKMAVGLRWTYEFARNSQERVSALRLWVADMAIENEDILIREAVGVGMSTIPANNSSDGLAHANPRFPASTPGNYDAETMEELVFSIPQRYTLNTVVGGPSTLTKWRLINSGSPNIPLDAFGSQASDLQRRFQSGNINIQYPENTIVYTQSIHPGAGVALDPNNNAHLDVSAGQLFFFDSSRLLEMARQRGAQTRETDQDPGHQFITEYFSDYYEIYIKDYNPRTKLYVS